MFARTLLFSALAAFVAASDVVDLNKDSYKEFINNEKLSLVEFFAPWCGHCKALAPEYEVAATELKGSSIKIAKVDCTVEADICSEFEVKGYPTLKVFREGTPSEYKGARTADSIVSYMKKQSLPALSELAADKVADFTKSNKVVVVAYLKDSTSDEHKVYSDLANKWRDEYVFGFTTDAEAAKEAGVTAPQVVLYKQFDEGKNIYSGKFVSSDILDFVKTNSVPLVDEIGPENYGFYVERGLPIAYLFYKSAEEKKKFGAVLEPIANAQKGKLSFVYIDAVKYGAHGKTLNLKEEWPAFAIQKAQENQKWPFDQSAELSSEALTKFVDDFLAGKLEPSLKSEPIPESNDGFVKVVVGKTYESIVMDKSKDVFLEIYAPWCGHCKKLTPIWEELGERVVGSDIVIAKMDGTENDLPADANFRIEGFPTLKLFKANDNTIVDYDGERNLEGFVEFLKGNAVNGKTIPEAKEKPASEKKDEEEHDEL